MGGALDFTALPVIAEILGIDDIELFVKQIALIRDFKNEQRES